MTSVTTSKLKDALSAYLRRVEHGEQILVLRGGKAVAAIVPVEETRAADEAGRLRQLAATELVVLPLSPEPLGDFSEPRVPNRGRPASSMILEDRG